MHNQLSISSSSPVAPATEKTAAKQLLPEANLPDERYPGTFFRIPGLPIPGKTTWSLVK
ncbi:MAG: hypothetical protein ABSB19_19915 [Methylomonas sp.]|jgi:hypothetical protein